MNFAVPPKCISFFMYMVILCFCELHSDITMEMTGILLRQYPV